MSNFPQRNFYEILNCSANATFEELKSNYKQLILQCHPDKLQQQQENKQQLEQDVLENLEIKNLPNNSQFMAITEAWNCLKDTQKRKQYDAELLLNKFHTHNNIYNHITLKEMKKQFNKENGEEFYTYDCRCGGQYIVDESAEQYFCTNNQPSPHTTLNNDDDIQQQNDKDNNGGGGVDGDAELNTQNNKNLKNNTNKNENNDDGSGANSEGVVFLQQNYKETPAAATPHPDFKHDNVNNEDNVDDDENDDNDGDLIVECSECSLEMRGASIPPGIRVVRGPNWIWQNQDGGEGHVGTVCEIGRSGSAHSPENTVVVNWDTGHRTNYRVGYQNQYDLIIVDNAQVGVRHSNVVCDGCSKGGIAGIVFKCAQCSNYHLCSYCYGDDKHDKEHPFIRYTTPTSVGVRVPPRKGVKRLYMRGIFVGAKVMRGPDWEWHQQDGGSGKTGKVLDIRGWDNESCRSVANVSWTAGTTNVYRVGHKGNVDLKCVIATIGGGYYKDHMPVLGQLEEQQPIVPTTLKPPMFSVGDRVKVCLELDALIKLQQGHGGWNPRMVAHLGKLGTVHRITEKGDIRVQYENCPNRWTFHPAALIKVVSFRVGDLVTIINDAAKVQQLQKGHGEWIELMRYALGKLCKVTKVYSDGDLRIEQLDDGFEWTLNPKCVKLERSPLATAAERSNSMMDLSHRRTDHVMTPLLSGLSGTSMADKLVRESAQGHIEFVKQYLDAHPEQVNVMSGGKACIQVAAHQGFVEIVKLLISKGANVNVVDKEGDSALHYAAFGNQPDTMRILLQNNANINFLNSSHCSALHICAHKKTPHCVRELLNFGADVNIQDSYGDTALHDAIGKENSEVVELLCNAPNLDFTVKNNRGFNVLHHAALKGNVVAAKRILQLARQLVNVKKDDGFAALHLAALNGHAPVVEALVKDGQAEIDIRNNRRQTPFLLAVSQGHSAAIEKLVKLGCDISARDEDGDNAMHLCVIKKANLLQGFEPTAEDSPDIFAVYESLAHIQEDRLMITILCYLSRLGCRIEQNNKGVTIFEWITDDILRKLILDNQQHGDEAAASTSAAAASNVAAAAANSVASNTEHIIQNIQQLNLGSHDLHAEVEGAIGLNTLTTDNRQDKPGSSKNHNRIEPTPPPIPPPASLNNSTATTTNTKTNNNNNEATGTGATAKITTEPVLLLPTTPHECVVCNETLELIKFEPCHHQISCEDCGKRMKKCLRCGAQIERRFDSNGRLITNTPSNDRLRYLENKIQEYEESHYCSICMERTRDVAFLCGHGACSRCAETLRTCHMCRKTILKKINLY